MTLHPHCLHCQWSLVQSKESSAVEQKVVLVGDHFRACALISTLSDIFIDLHLGPVSVKPTLYFWWYKMIKGLIFKWASVRNFTSEVKDVTKWGVLKNRSLIVKLKCKKVCGDLVVKVEKKKKMAYVTPFWLESVLCRLVLPKLPSPLWHLRHVTFGS